MLFFGLGKDECCDPMQNEMQIYFKMQMQNEIQCGD